MKKLIEKTLFLFCAAALVLVFVFSLAACGGETDPAEDPSDTETKEIVSVSITQDGKAVDTLEVTYSEGYTIELAATVEQKGDMSTSVTWSSSDTEIASVTRAGKVNFKGKRGSVVITAASSADPSKSDSVTINVSVPYIPVLTIDSLGEYRFEAELADVSGCDVADMGSLTNTVIEYPENPAVSGGNLGNFNVAGNVIAFVADSKAAAKAELTFRLAPGGRSDEPINVDDVAVISLNDTVIETGITVPPSASTPWFDYNDYKCATTVDLIAGTNIMKIEMLNDPGDSNKLMPNIDYIDYNVVEYDGEVPEGEVTSVTVLGADGEEAEDIVLDYDGTVTSYTFSAAVSKTGNKKDTVVWSSDRENVASVDQSGVVTLTGVRGTAVITATATDDATKSDSVSITVNVPYESVITLDALDTFRFEAEKADVSNCIPGANNMPEDATIIESLDSEYISGDNLGNLNTAGNEIGFAVTNAGSQNAKVRFMFRMAPSGGGTPYAFDEAAKLEFNGEPFTTGITVARVNEDRQTWLDYADYYSEGVFTLVPGLNILTVTVLTDYNDDEISARMPNLDYVDWIVTEYEGESAPEVTSVTITKDGADAGDSYEHKYEAGTADSIALSATVVKTGDLSEDVLWSSDNKRVATVDEQGNVTFTGVRGAAVITAASAADPLVKDSLMINVEVPYVPVIEIDGDNTYKFEAELSDVSGCQPGAWGPTIETGGDTSIISGGSNIGNLDADGNTIAFVVNSKAAAKVSFTFRLTSVSEGEEPLCIDDVADFSFNGTDFDTGVTVSAVEPGGGKWYHTYNSYECELSFDLVEGINVLEIVAHYDGSAQMPNIDYIDFVVTGYGASAAA